MELDDKELEKLKELVPYKILSPTPQEIITEIERLHSIIKEVREYIKKNSIYYPTSDGCQWVDQFKVLEILDKGE